jgi:hypothetical protein
MSKPRKSIRKCKTESKYLSNFNYCTRRLHTAHFLPRDSLPTTSVNCHDMYSCPYLFTAYSRISVFLCRSGMCCTFILFYFIFNLFHITTRQSYTKNHGIRRNTSGAMDSLNTQHCVLLKHRIISRTHIESIQCFRSMQYSITSNVSCVRVHSHP